jgi:transcriptional pleiotropic regulator of transition state genes
MKATGIVRKVDGLGRIVLPVELRRERGILVNGAIEIFTEDEKIIMQKYEPACVFCESADDVAEYKGRKVCKSCIEELGGDKLVHNLS